MKEKICCVCGHPLNKHIDEKEYWRCHSLSKDGYQCECRLLKNVADEEGINYYDVDKRIDEFIEDLIKCFKML